MIDRCFNDSSESPAGAETLTEINVNRVYLHYSKIYNFHSFTLSFTNSEFQNIFRNQASMKTGKLLVYFVLLSAFLSACGGSGQQMASVSPSQSKGATPQSNPALPSDWVQTITIASTLSSPSSPADETVPTQEPEQQQAPAPAAPTKPSPPQSDIPRAPQPQAPTEPTAPSLPRLPPPPSPGSPSQPEAPPPSVEAPTPSTPEALPPTDSRLRNEIEEFQEFRNQPALSLVKAQYAYARGASGKGVVIGIVDDGIDRRHREFSGGKIAELTYASGYTPNYDSCPSGYGSDCLGDVNYHGTTVGGVLVGNRQDTGGTAAMHGIAYGSRLVVTGIRLGSGSPETRYSSEEIDDSEPSSGDPFFAAIFNWLNSRVSVANMSFSRTDSIAGTGREKLLRSFPTALEALQQAGTPRADRTVYVWSAGNAGNSNYADETVKSNVLLYAGFPLRITELQGQFIAVVAVDTSTGVIAPYSNHCGLSKAFCMAAPGTVSAPVPNIICGPGRTGCYGTGVTGTSYASPLVAGGVALLKQHYRGQLGHHEIVERLLATANDDGIYADEDIYGQGLMDLDAATQPVGTTRLLTGEDLGGESARERASSISLGPAFGDAFQRGFASRNIAAFDTMNAPFFRSLDSYAQPVPAASVTLNSRLSALGNTQAMASWSHHGFDFSAQAVQTEHEDEATFYSGPGIGAGFNHSSSTLGMFSVTGKLGDREGYLGFRMHPGWRLGLYGTGALKIGTFSEDTAFTNPMLSLVRNGATAGMTLNGISSTNQNLRIAAFAGNSQYGDRQDDSSSQAHGAIVEYSPFSNRKNGLSVQAGWLQEPRGLVGSRASGAFGSLGANTGFAGLSAHTSINKNWTLLANLHGGLTRTSVKRLGMITSISPLKVSAFDLGLSGENVAHRNDTLAFRVSQPLRVESGSAEVRWISGRTRYEEINVEQQSLSLEPSGRQIDVELTYGRPWRSGHANFGAIVSRHTGHSVGTSDSAFLMRYNRSF